MNLKWDDLKLFLTVHEQGSLSGAARALKLGQPTLSRRIAELERIVGETLFERQSQGARLTPAGQKLLPAVQNMAEWANEAQLSAAKQTGLPEGRVRIAAPPGIAYGIIVPLAAKIHRQHPGIQVEVLSGVETLHLGRGEADLSLRTTRPTDGDLICIDEISSAFRVYASRTYAAQRPSGPGFADLDWICWAAPYDQLHANQKLNALIPGFKPAFTSDDFIVQLAACKTGIGVMILPQLLAQYDGLNELQELDIDLGPDALGSLFLVCHKRRRHLPRIQLVMNVISSEFESLRNTPKMNPDINPSR